jgi:DNA-binding CsgD family transcriptional regulator
MIDFPDLSKREKEVLNLLLQGKSNKMIAASLRVSVRTVEFHLGNIYAKFQVKSRVELILKLGYSTGGRSEKLGDSTVAFRAKDADNRDRLSYNRLWTTFFRAVISNIAKEADMKILKSRHVSFSIIAALLTGLSWIVWLEYTGYVLWEDFKAFVIPLGIILVLIGFIVSSVGNYWNKTLPRVLLSVVFGVGVFPFTLVPVLRFVVWPVAKLFANLGFFDPATMPAETASNILMGIALGLWLVVGSILGLMGLLVSFDVPSKDCSSEMVGRA